jgi:hypothetical protein
MNATRANAMNGSGVVGIFAYVDVAVEAVRRLRERGWQAVRVYAPVPNHALLEEVGRDAKRSPMRAFALVGGIAGTIAGFGLASFAGLKMHTFQGLLVAGKPPVSIPAYLIVGFELTVLIGALATMAGFLINARLPNWRHAPGYDEKFSDDRFGIFVPCDASRFDEVANLMHEAGADETRFERGEEESSRI